MTPAAVFASYKQQHIALRDGSLLSFVVPIVCHCVRKERHLKIVEVTR